MLSILLKNELFFIKLKTMDYIANSRSVGSFNPHIKK